jgi:hypothetical protein
LPGGADAGPINRYQGIADTFVRLIPIRVSAKYQLRELLTKANPVGLIGKTDYDPAITE